MWAIVATVFVFRDAFAWQQPILRLGDTAIGVAIGVAAAACLQHATLIERSRRNRCTTKPTTRRDADRQTRPAQRPQPLPRDDEEGSMITPALSG
jgi:hypothetical protein